MTQASALTPDITYVMVDKFQGEIYMTLFQGIDDVNVKHFVSPCRPDFEVTLNDLENRFAIGGEEALINSGFNVEGYTVYKLA